MGGANLLMRGDEFDPYRRDGEAQDAEDFTVLVRFLEDLDKFVDDLFHDPPAAMRGEWLNEQREAWTELRARNTQTLAMRLVSERGNQDMTRLADHGLTGRSARAKMLAWRDRVREFLALRNCRRAAKALRSGAVIMESVADVLGWGHAYKEAIKGLHHLSEIAIEEGA